MGHIGPGVKLIEIIVKTKIRPVTVIEIIKIAEYLPAFYEEFGGPYKYEKDAFIISWIDWLRGPAHVLLGAFDGDKWVGGIGGVIARHPYTSNQILGEELFWYVTHEYRRSGVGSQLIDAYESWLKERGVNYILMVYSHGNSPKGIDKFYKSKGFSDFETQVIKEI